MKSWKRYSDPPTKLHIRQHFNHHPLHNGNSIDRKNKFLLIRYNWEKKCQWNEINSASVSNCGGNTFLLFITHTRTYFIAGTNKTRENRINTFRMRPPVILKTTSLSDSYTSPSDRRLNTLAKHFTTALQPMASNDSISASPTAASDSVFNHLVRAPEDPILGVIFSSLITIYSSSSKLWSYNVLDEIAFFTFFRSSSSLDRVIREIVLLTFIQQYHFDDLFGLFLINESRFRLLRKIIVSLRDLELCSCVWLRVSFEDTRHVMPMPCCVALPMKIVHVILILMRVIVRFFFSSFVVSRLVLFTLFACLKIGDGCV